MKNIVKSIAFATLVFLLSVVNSYSQKEKRGYHRNHIKRVHHNKVVVHRHYGNYGRSQYRPNRIRNFRPMWAHNRNYHRRWVYFPAYNFYWDNWRQMYVYQNNTVWYVNSTPPPTIVNVNIENEKHYELDAKEDDLDSIYKSNATHSEDYIKK